jgi:hypothetical protein
MAERKYYYEIKGVKCLEVCPYLEKPHLLEKEQIKIGSVTCRQCIHNIETSPYNEEKGWVICKKMKDEDIPLRDKKIVLLPIFSSLIEASDILVLSYTSIKVPKGTEILGITKEFDDDIFLILLQPIDFQEYENKKIELYEVEQPIEEGNRKYIGNYYRNGYKFVFEKIV